MLLQPAGDPSLRNGSRAVELAEKAVAVTHRKDPNLLDTLAAAYAEAGHFSQAVAAQKEAIDLLRDAPRKTDFASRLALYETNTPAREDD